MTELAARLVSDGKASEPFPDEPFDTRSIKLYARAARPRPGPFQPGTLATTNFEGNHYPPNQVLHEVGGVAFRTALHTSTLSAHSHTCCTLAARRCTLTARRCTLTTVASDATNKDLTFVADIVSVRLDNLV